MRRATSQPFKPCQPHFRQKIAPMASQLYTLIMDAVKNYVYITLVTAITSYLLTNMGAALL